MAIMLADLNSDLYRQAHAEEKTLSMFLEEQRRVYFLGVMEHGCDFSTEKIVIATASR